jgi:hypothetical protein
MHGHMDVKIKTGIVAFHTVCKIIHAMLQCYLERPSFYPLPINYRNDKGRKILLTF